MRAFLFQVEDVVQGKSADGGESHLPALPLKPESAEVATAATVVRYIARILADPLEPDILPDLIRTAICWKAAAHVSKVGRKNFSVGALNKDARDAAFYLIDHPKLVVAKTSFAGLVRLAQEDLSRQRAAEEKAAAEAREQKIAELRIGSGAPPRLVIWQEPPYRVEELIHPFHVWEEGFRMRNCLQGYVRDVIPRDASRLRQLAFWQSVEKAGRHIYALRRSDKRLATFTHAENVLTEIQVGGDVYEVAAVMSDIIAYLETLYGPMSTGHRWHLKFRPDQPGLTPWRGGER